LSSARAAPAKPTALTSATTKKLVFRIENLLISASSSETGGACASQLEPQLNVETGPASKKNGPGDPGPLVWLNVEIQYPPGQTAFQR
jgi:hypothetical protein